MVNFKKALENYEFENIYYNLKPELEKIYRVYGLDQKSK